MHSRQRGADVLRAQDDGTARLSDSGLLDRATELGRVIVTYDDDFLADAVERQRTGVRFSGVVFVSTGGMSVGELAEQLQIVAECMTIGEFADRIIYIPL